MFLFQKWSKKTEWNQLMWFTWKTVIKTNNVVDIALYFTVVNFM